ncbi:unnamed protein product [Penicillium bialowiezense]
MQQASETPLLSYPNLNKRFFISVQGALAENLTDDAHIFFIIYIGVHFITSDQKINRGKDSLQDHTSLLNLPCTMNRNEDTQDLEEDEVLKAYQKAIGLNLCPNRVWAVAGENIAKLLPKSLMIPVEKGQNDENNNFENHDECTSNFCEYSQRDFTRVQQRHECIEEENCKPLDMFPRDALDYAAEAEESTVWTLEGNHLLDLPQPYMAISHVWADGTGTGAWEEGEVNECLWEFFRDIAKQFRCKGIWWDTLCIPSSKTARNKAITKIQKNYLEARITLVHDRFLRSWEWDPETACFAILMSPWFSRGWTALELAKSRKVKVIFKGPHGPLIKDLDEEILTKFEGSEPNTPRQKASQIIMNLRKNIRKLNDLLNVLGPRHTSWPKDMTTISALLVDASRKEWQQDTYKNILRKFGQLAPGHLFHNSATMTKEFSWCPPKLFDLPLDDSDDFLSIAPNGDIHGKWIVIPADHETEKACWWGGTHSLMRRKLQIALRQYQKCWLLAELHPRQGSASVSRALLVKETRTQFRYQYVGALYFQGKLGADGAPSLGPIKEVTISSYQTELEENAAAQNGNIFTIGEQLAHAETMGIERSGNIIQPLAFIYSIWTGDYRTIYRTIESAVQGARRGTRFQRESGLLQFFKQIPFALSVASERGDIKMVRDLLRLETDLDERCFHKRKALYWAAWSGSVDVVNRLLPLLSRADISRGGKSRNTALHVTAQMGFEPIAKLLVSKIDPNSKGYNGLTPLHLAAMGGYTSVVEVLGHADVQIKDNLIHWTPLHFAASHGDPALVKLLIERGAIVDIEDDTVHWTPLHIAAMSGHIAAVDLLLSKSPRQAVQDKFGWTPRHFAELNGHAQIAEMLYRAECKSRSALSTIGDSLTLLHCKVIQDGRLAIKPLFEQGNDFYFERHGDKKILRQFTVDVALGTAIESLLTDSANAIKTGRQLPPHRGAQRWERLEDAFKKIKKREDCWETIQSARSGGPEGFTWVFVQNFVSSDNYGGGPGALHIAVKGGNENFLRLLFMKGSREFLECEDGDNCSPLMVAIHEKNETIVRLLLKEGADPSTGGNELSTPALAWALDYESDSIVRLLLEAGADPNGCDRHGETVLMAAAGNGNRAMVQLLLDKGADAEVKDAWDNDLLYHAHSTILEDLKRLLGVN